ncbi:MAG: hypothetical protein KC983_10940, partial [Phycisphaerales bacterium]|nr:hypothetical protein [Phycisphaerales bacterium]
MPSRRVLPALFVLLIAQCLPSAIALGQDASDVDAETLNAYIEMLQDEDRSVRKAAAEKMLEIGDPALEAIEQAIRERRASTLGQTKLVLLELRNRRIDREWTERLATLEARMDGAVYAVGSSKSRPLSRITYHVKSVDGDPTLLEFDIELYRIASRQTTHVTARCKRDRSLTPVAITMTPERAPAVHATYERRKATVETNGKSTTLEMPAPIGVDLLFIPMVSCMPMRADNMLIFDEVRCNEMESVPMFRTTMTCTGRKNPAGLDVVEIASTGRTDNRRGFAYTAHVDAGGRVLDLLTE